MSNFVLNPNLPKNKVKTVLVGSNNRLVYALKEIGIDAVVLDDNPFVDESVCDHVDCAAFYFGNGEILLDKRQQRVYNTLSEKGFKVKLTDEYICGEYPGDVLLNCACVDEYIICNKKYTDKNILSTDRIIIDVRQGYAKCSICVVSEGAIITDDVGIYNKAKAYLQVLLIEKGDIFLRGKPYGFIGGASCKISNDTIAFFGDINTHKNSEEIKAFLSKHGIKYVCLFDGKLIDTGGMIAICETEDNHE